MKIDVRNYVVRCYDLYIKETFNAMTYVQWQHGSIFLYQYKNIT